MSYIVKVLPDVCIGAATCVLDAPNTFEMNDDNIAVVIDPHGDSDADILNAAKNCTADAIELIDEATGKKVWP